jgi:uncharacterized protein (DUF885 family)
MKNLAPISIMSTLICASTALSSSAARAGDDAGSRFRDLYTREWTWREAQFAGEDDENENSPPADHLPKVDRATQEMREKYWTGCSHELATHRRERTRRRGSCQLRGVPESNRRLRDDQRLRDMANAAQQRHDVLDRPRIHGAPPDATEESYRRYLSLLADVPRYFAEQTANMRAGLERGFSVPRVTLTGRDKSITDIIDAPGETNLFYTPFVHMPAGIGVEQQAKLRAEACRRSARRHPGLRQTARIHAQRLHAPRARAARRRGAAKRQGLLPHAHPRIHDARPGSRRHSRVGPARSRAHPRADAGNHGRKRIHRKLQGISDISCGPIRSSTQRAARSC